MVAVVAVVEVVEVTVVAVEVLVRGPSSPSPVPQARTSLTL